MLSTIGCGTTNKASEKTPTISDKALEDYLAKRSQLLTREETEKGTRFLESDWNVTVDTDPSKRAISSAGSKTALGSNSDLSQLSAAHIKINQNQQLDVGGPDGKSELLFLPVGVDISIGEVGSAKMDSVVAQLDALAKRDTARAEGAATILTAAYQGLALVVDIEGQRRVEQINAKAGMWARIITGAGKVVTGVIEGFNPYTTGAKILEKIVVRDSNTGEKHEGTLAGQNPILKSTVVE